MPATNQASTNLVQHVKYNLLANAGDKSQNKSIKNTDKISLRAFKKGRKVTIWQLYVFYFKKDKHGKKSILIQAAFKEVVAVYYICMITNSMFLWVIIQIIGLGHTPVYK